jgi:hypothetical protein
MRNGVVIVGAGRFYDCRMSAMGRWPALTWPGERQQCIAYLPVTRRRRQYEGLQSLGVPRRRTAVGQEPSSATGSFPAFQLWLMYTASASDGGVVQIGGRRSA